MIGAQSKLEYGDGLALTAWFGDHAFAHVTYSRLITGAMPVMDVADQRALAEWTALMEASARGDELPTIESLPAWLLAHNTLHAAELAGVKVSLNADVSSGDFSDAEAFYDWMDRHQRLHDAQNAALGI